MVTTLIDFYGLKTEHGFPMWTESKKNSTINEQLDTLEMAMKNDLNQSIRHRFIPYIQVYEFEALLFADASIFEHQFVKSEFFDYDYLQKTLQINPEEINDGVQTAPSKRLERIIKNYNKVVYGSLLSQEIGLDKIRSKCPRFNNWISALEHI